MSESIRLYTQQYVEHGFERRGLFELLDAEYRVESCLYPGCFIHCTPSFFYRRSIYVDTDNRAARFFKSSTVKSFIETNAVHAGKINFQFHHMSYETDLPEKENSFDLLLSLYAGFIGPTCVRYLKLGGILVANNSHGDASMASLDSRLRFVGAIHSRDERYRLVSNELDRYLVPKKQLEITSSFLRKMGRGVGYTRPAQYYVFERVS